MTITFTSIFTGSATTLSLQLKLPEKRQDARAGAAAASCDQPRTCRAA